MDNPQHANAAGCWPDADGDQRGSLLIIVLWWLLILGIMALALYAAVRPRVDLARRLQERAAGHYAARAALFAAMALVQEDDSPGFDGMGDLWANNEAVFKAMSFGGRQFSLGYPVATGQPTEDDQPLLVYGLADEERRLNLNRAPLETLQRLFEIVGRLPSLESASLAAAVVDWRDEDDEPLEGGAEALSYRELSPPYSPRNAPFLVAEELLLVKGITPALFRQIEPHVTVYGSGAVNLNTASRTVLQCLGLGAAALDAIDAYRAGPDGIPGTGDDLPFERSGEIVKTLEESTALSQEARAEIRRAVNARWLTVRSDNFRGHLFRQLDNQPSGVHIIFVFNRSGAVRLWREI